jgi:hypothetical protein
MAEQEIFKIDLDNKDFVKNVTESLKALQSLGESNEGLKEVVGSFFEAGKALGLLSASVLIVKSAIEETFRAERIEQINKQFDLLTEAAGLSGEKIKSEMMKAADGLLSATEATDLANKAIVRLGQSADKIPEIMELSRKIGTVTGQELNQVFTEFSNTLAAGNVRGLKQYGIFVDQKKAVQEYAQALGVSTDSLTRQGQIQAIVNAALEAGKERYAAVQTGTAQATESFERLKASLAGLKGAFDTIFSASAPALAAAFDFVSQRVDFLAKTIQNSLGGGSTQDKIEDLEVKLGSLREEMIKLQSQSKLPWFEGGTENAGKSLEELKKEIVATEAEINGLNQKSQEAQANAVNAGGAGPKDTEGLVDKDRQLKEEQALQEKLLSIRSQSLEMQKQNSRDETQIASITAQQKELIEQQFQLKKEELEREAREKNINNDEQIVALEEQKDLKLQQLDQQLYQDRIRALDNYQRASESTAQGVGRAFEVQSKKSALDLQKGFALGDAATKAFKKNSTDALLAFGSGAQTAGEAFKGFMFGAIADTAQAFGEQALAAGLVPPNPLYLAAGAGLIALAGFLRSKSKGASDFSGGVGGGGGGGGGGAGLTGPDNTLLSKQESKAVSITVQGSYYETEQTRTRLVDMIRESSDFTDFSFRQIGK